MRVGIDVDEIKNVTIINQVINGPFESVLAARREVHSHTNVSISRHFDLLLCLGMRYKNKVLAA